MVVYSQTAVVDINIFSTTLCGCHTNVSPLKSIPSHDVTNIGIQDVAAPARKPTNLSSYVSVALLLERVHSQIGCSRQTGSCIVYVSCIQCQYLRCYIRVCRSVVFKV